MALAYSVRPIRLKERGVWGLLAAAVAQWSLPLAVSAAQPGGWLRPLAWLLSALGLAIGLRWMAVHQLPDARGPTGGRANLRVEWRGCMACACECVRGELVAHGDPAPRLADVDTGRHRTRLLGIACGHRSAARLGPSARGSGVV
jgi:hypothetical protein